MKKTNALRILDRHKLSYQLFEYEYGNEELRTSKLEEETGLTRAHIYKTLLAKGDKNGILVAIVPIDGRLNYKAIAKLSGNKKVALTPLKDLTTLTTYVRGGCSPVGMKKSYPTFLDASALEYEEIFVNAGQRGLLMRINPNDLASVTSAVINDIQEVVED